MTDDLRSQIEILARDNVIVHDCLEYYYRGDATMEDALAAMVIELARISKDQHEQLLNYVMRYGTEAL